MKVNFGFNTKSYYRNINKEQNLDKTTQTPTIHPEMRNVFAYKDYISFGERLNRTPEEFYALPFNQQNMPARVKEYLYEDYEERQHMPPAQLQKEAYQYLKIADNVEDVKSIYENEPLFADLRPFSATNAKRGTLFLLRWDALTSNTPIFKNKNEKDLTVYFLKKVYLEGKTLKEINEDFDKDSTDEIKKELGVKDGKYFSAADLRSLGIKYPNLSYYNSFLATRNDKEYIPKKRTTDLNRNQAQVPESAKTTEQNEEPVQTAEPRVVSEETKEKLSEAKKRWWSNLSPEAREEQIQKMIEGKEFSNSTFSKYQGPIMTIAAAKIGFSERMISIITEKFADEDFTENNETFAQKQREIMLEFWHKDADFKEKYSNALKSTIEDFEKAISQQDGQDELEKLLNSALEIKKSVIEKAKERELAKKAEKGQKNENPQPTQTTSQTKAPQKPSFDLNSEKDIKRLFRQMENSILQIYPDMFREEMLRFLMRNTTLEEKRAEIILNNAEARAISGLSDEETEKLLEEAGERIENINQNFNKEQRLIAITNDFILNKFLFEVLESPNVFKYERGDFNKLVDELYLSERVKNAKPRFNKEMKTLASPLSDKNVEKFLQNEFLKHLNDIAANGFRSYKNELEQNSKEIIAQLRQLSTIIRFDKDFEKATINFFKNYNAPIRYIKNSCKNKEAENAIIEKMIIEYLMFSMEFYNKKTVNNNQKSPNIDAAKKQIEEVSKALTKEEAVNGFKYFAEKQVAVFSTSFNDELINFISTHPTMNKTDMITFMLIESGMIDDKDFTMDNQTKDAIKLELLHKMNRINNEFDRKYKLQTKSNEFAANEILYEITANPEVFKNTRADSAIHASKENFSEDVVEKIKNKVNEKYAEYVVGLTDEEAQYFYENCLKQKISTVHQYGFKYHDDISVDKAKTLCNLIKTIPENVILDYVKNFKGAVDYINKDNTPIEVKKLLTEHIVYDFICEIVPMYAK